MTYTVHEFSAYPNAQNEFLWPADKTTTAIAASGTLTTGANVRAVVITCDADGRVSFNGSAATADGVPVLSALENTFLFGDPAAHTIKFL